VTFGLSSTISRSINFPGIVIPSFSKLRSNRAYLEAQLEKTTNSTGINENNNLDIKIYYKKLTNY
jgi:hypothetical protein